MTSALSRLQPLNGNNIFDDIQKNHAERRGFFMDVRYYANKIYLYILI